MQPSHAPKGDVSLALRQMMRTKALGCRLVPTMAAVALAAGVAVAGPPADSEAARVAAETVRDRGLPCAEPVSAQRDQGQAKPDEAVWILVCGDGRYRVQYMGEMPPKIERLQ